MLISMRWGLRTCSATTYVFPSVDSSSKNLTPGTTRFTQVCASLRSFKLGSLRIPAPLPRCASKIVNTCTRLAGSSQSPVSFATTLSVRQLWILLRRILRCELNDSHKFVRRVAPSNLVLCLFHAAYSTLYFLHTSTILAGSRPDEARSVSSVKKDGHTIRYDRLFLLISDYLSFSLSLERKWCNTICASLCSFKSFALLFPWPRPGRIGSQ